MRSYPAFAFALLTAAAGFAGEPAKKIIVPPEEDHWKLMLAVPGWMAGLDGTMGVDGFNSHVDVGFKNLINKVDMIWATRAELSNGRFGILGEFIYTSLSDSIGVGGPLRKIDVRGDEYLADLALRWRVIENDRGFLDLLAGVRYTNIFQEVDLQSDDKAIDATTDEFVDEIGSRLRDRLDEVLSDDRFKNALTELVKNRLIDRIESITRPERQERSVPTAPLAHGTTTRLEREIDRLVRRAEAQLVRTTLATARAAAEAEREAIQAATAAVRVAAQQRAAALRAAVNQRIASAKRDLDKKIQDRLHDALNEHFALGVDWWDPYVGLRVRYNVTPAIYLQARGDIGGFGVGSDLMWQFEGAVGVQLTHKIFAEVGYRALSFDYDEDGFVYDVITNGAQITLGLEF
ncbi:MAG TPA: hypothetical protein VFD27_13195 [Chthoniobacteraceae bacterium]|nr:hypothetical protein [Chthoniobacteraceae bacterium]